VIHVCTPARPLIREPAAEFVGTMILVIFGLGANCQATLSANSAVASSPKGVSHLDSMRFT
jgi:aquaglyceroporin related protein, other eukaryote